MKQKSYREIFMDHYGEIQEGFEIHHKLPVRMGGTDEIENLEAVSRKDHAERHKDLYEKHGDIKDLCAFYMLSGTFDKKTHSSIGGKIGGKKTYQERLGIHNYTPELKKQWTSDAGKIGGKVQAERGQGCHKYKTDPKIHKEWASKGGNAGIFRTDYFMKQGYSEEESKILIKEQQSERGKKGGPKNRGFIWLNDGKKSVKYTAFMQENCSLEEFLKLNPVYSRGRPPRNWTMTKKEKEHEN